ncbi:hypothetical protein C8261_12570 [Pseudothauera lacus]|uniref:DUF2971 domain-containing protein n=2 Tax=Pseudothauera lacus TaxID=2136175 RepID=A0A2T4IDH5_9RHOO|nr:hypothetical protein C8261_12570 [Pseudothauera lacus]
MRSKFGMRKLYRYQPTLTPGDDRLSLLQNGEVWFSDPAKFNDPFDLKPRISNLMLDRWCDAPGFDAAMRRALSELLADPAIYQGALFIDPALANEFREWTADDAGHEKAWDARLQYAIEKRISQFGVVCLTPQWDSRLMWAHYADQGQGFCIEYEVDWTLNNQDVRYVPVQYTSEIPELCLSEAMFTPHQFLYRVLATKHSDWAYEQEVRLVCLTGKAQSVKLNPNFVRMTGLIAGHAMPEPLRAHLKETAARLGVTALGVNTHAHGRFHMEPLA